MARILVTGADGYIGSHVVKTAAEHGHEVFGFDNSVTGNFQEVKQYCRKFYINDLTGGWWGGNGYDAIIHLGAKIDVHESTQIPSEYYTTNIQGTINMLNKNQCDHFILASTGAAFDPISPYARSKLAAEDVVKELAGDYSIFRFFNVAGANGMRQTGKATHLIRVAARVAAGKQDYLTINGRDFDTPDGTCIREYVHVQSVADALVKAINKPANSEYECISSGEAHSNLEVAKVMQDICGQEFRFYFSDERREGDPDILRAPSISSYYEHKYTIEDMCRSAIEMEKLYND